MGKSVQQVPENKKMKKDFDELYQLSGKILGQGSYGRVEVCLHVDSGQEFAVKIIQKQPLQNSRRRVFKEVEICHACSKQPNIVQLISFFEDEQNFYLIFEKANRGDLFKIITETGPLKEDDVKPIIKDITNALHFLHGIGVAHRDLKPENVLCSSEETLRIKVCDFDLASEISYEPDQRNPSLSSPVGSAQYTSPEVVRLFQGFPAVYDKKCDMWSLGVILYVLLCGYTPFDGCCGKTCGWKEGLQCYQCEDLLFHSILEDDVAFPDTEWRDVSYKAKDLIRRLLEKDPNMRPTSDEILNDEWLCQQVANVPTSCRNYYRDYDKSDTCPSIII